MYPKTLNAPKSTSTPAQKQLGLNQFFFVWLGLIAIQLLPTLNFNIVPHSRTIPAVVSVLFLVLGISHKLRVKPSLRLNLRIEAVPVLAMLGILQAGSIVFHMNFLQSVTIFATATVLLWAVIGSGGLKLFAPILLFAAFAFIPAPEELTRYLMIPMQNISATATVFLLKPFMPITGVGHLFIVDGHKFDVAPECSGLNQWVALSYFFLLSAMFFRYRAMGYIVGLCADPIITLCMNVARLMTTAVVAYFSTVQQAVAVHTNVEFLIFPIGIIALWLLLRGFKNGA